MYAAGAEEVVEEPRYAHLIGGARMGDDPRASVVDSFGRSHDIPNLFLCDGSIFPTQGSANPGLTIQALAARTADYLIAEGDAVTSRDRRLHAAPPIRYDLSPRGVAGRGMPRVKSSAHGISVGLGGLAIGNDD
jgi:choline dehydrogenase-like flavoprotein